MKPKTFRRRLDALGMAKVWLPGCIEIEQLDHASGMALAELVQSLLRGAKGIFVARAVDPPSAPLLFFAIQCTVRRLVRFVGRLLRQPRLRPSQLSGFRLQKPAQIRRFGGRVNRRSPEARRIP